MTKHFLNNVLDLALKYSKKTEIACLYSGGDKDSAKRSFLLLNPIEEVAVYEKKQVKSLLNKGIQKEFFFKDPWDALRRLISFEKSYFPPNIPLWVGYFSYEMGMFAEKSKQIPHQLPIIPLACFRRYETVIVFDLEKESVQQFGKKVSLTIDNKQEFTFPFQGKVKIENKESYIKKVEAIQRLIKEGEVYQVNLSHRVKLQGKVNPFFLYYNLAKRSSAPFCAFFQTGSFSFLSLSPERFLKKQGNTLETHPIKGTVRRGKTKEEDMLLKDKLYRCQKNQSELLMITDLSRNDLGKVSVAGTVKVRKLQVLESYSNVHHLKSVIVSKAKENIHVIDMIRNCFPGGSITGCPKLRAMEVIAQLEDDERGVYTGSIGYFTPNGDFDFNIAIRTAVYHKGELTFGVGGAVVWDSSPEEEYLETLDKGKHFFDLLKSEENGLK